MWLNILSVTSVFQLVCVFTSLGWHAMLEKDNDVGWYLLPGTSIVSGVSLCLVAAMHMIDWHKRRRQRRAFGVLDPYVY